MVHKNSYAEASEDRRLVMRLPQLQNVAYGKTTVGDFRGLNEQEITNANEFADMENLSSDMYPGLTIRHSRGSVLHSLTKPNGLYWKNKLFYVDGTKMYYDGTQIGTCTDNKKKLVGMGAYICIFPDKKVYNTSTGALTSIEASWNGSVTGAPVSTGSTFIKINGSGIGNNFNAGDAVKFTNVNVSSLNNTTKIIQEKGTDYIVIIDSEITASFSDSSITVARQCPDFDFVCEFNNRLWACSNTNHEIYASKLGDPLNWNAFEGLSTDSYALTIGSDGDFTGCLSHQGYVVFFKEDYIHTIYGTKPSNFQLDTTQARGPMKGCEDSLCRVDETVYYASRKGICSFQGSIPESISDKLTIKYTKAVANQYNHKLYMSLFDGTEWHMYVYDAARSRRYNMELWHKEDDLQMQMTAYGDGKLYIVDGENKIRTICDDESYDANIEWYAESGIIEEGSLDRKKVHKIQFNVELDKNNLFEVYVKYDNSDEWIRVYSLMKTEKTTRVIPLRIGRCWHYRYKLHGIGRFKLFGLSRAVEYGSDK